MTSPKTPIGNLAGFQGAKLEEDKPKSGNFLQLPLSPMPRNLLSNLTNQDNDTRPSGSQPQLVNYRGAKQYKFKAQIGEGAVGKVFQVIH